MVRYSFEEKDKRRISPTILEDVKQFRRCETMAEIGNQVQQFYNTTPFPDYELDRFGTKEDLRIASSSFAKILDRSIPKYASIIDVGTGTGQLSAFLSLRREKVLGIDFSDASLKKAMALKEKLQLKSWHLKKCNIFDKEQIKELGTFDYVLCLGVLHHTENAYQGFKNILPLVKPGGYIAVGLYNTFGRFPLHVRQILAKSVFKNNAKVKDFFMEMQIGKTEDKEKVRGWWNDQYCHPHETTHKVGEVMKWFEKNNIEYYQTVPSTKLLDESTLDIAGVWNKESLPSLSVRAITQIRWIWETHHEGGYWITFGKKGEY